MFSRFFTLLYFISFLSSLLTSLHALPHPKMMNVNDINKDAPMNPETRDSWMSHHVPTEVPTSFSSTTTTTSSSSLNPSMSYQDAQRIFHQTVARVEKQYRRKYKHLIRETRHQIETEFYARQDIRQWQLFEQELLQQLEKMKTDYQTESTQLWKEIQWLQHQSEPMKQQRSTVVEPPSSLMGSHGSFTSTQELLESKRALLQDTRRRWLNSKDNLVNQINAFRQQMNKVIDQERVKLQALANERFDVKWNELMHWKIDTIIKRAKKKNIKEEWIQSLINVLIEKENEEKMKNEK